MSPIFPARLPAWALALFIVGCGNTGPASMSPPGHSLAGPPVQPFFCATPKPRPATADSPATNASGLSQPAADADCATPAETSWYYRTTETGCSLALPDPWAPVPPDATTAPAPPAAPAHSCFRPLPAGALPLDLAQTTTDTGQRIPYIVRLERGVIGRGIYDIAVLAEPGRRSGALQEAHWNGKVYYQFGPGTGQPRRQSRPQDPWTQTDALLARGWLVAGNSQTDSRANANRVLTADVLAMMKDHIAVAYGQIRFILGTGGSGGAINSHVVGSVRPGLLDGVVVYGEFADAQTTLLEVSDCRLLVEAYQRPAWRSLMAAQGTSTVDEAAMQAAINGHVDASGCRGWQASFANLFEAGQYRRRVASLADGTLATTGPEVNNCQLPAALVYDRRQHPQGARCDISGAAPAAQGPTDDNEGVLYGLGALKSGAITPEAFVVLNESIGGVNVDGAFQPQRSHADTASLALAYRSGVVVDGHALAGTAVIDVRGWDDSGLVLPPGASSTSRSPIHHVWRSFSSRARLLRDTGSTAGHALWRIGRGGVYPQAVAPAAIEAMDLWLTALSADRSARPLPERVAAARPPQARDFCLRSDDVAQATPLQGAACDSDPFLRPSASPRQVAGGPLTEDVLKCQRHPLTEADVQDRLDAVRMERLRAVFPGGVCDWSRPGVGQQASQAPMDFSGAVPVPVAAREAVRP